VADGRTDGHGALVMPALAQQRLHSLLCYRAVKSGNCVHHSDMLDEGEPGEKTTTTQTARLRLCLLRLWSNFNGFGFVLTADSERQGLYIGSVEDPSPAKAGGLKSGDRIVEVSHCRLSGPAVG